MKNIFAVLLIVPVMAYGFDATRNVTNSTLITWKQVDNIQNTCEQESRKRGYGGFGYSLEACAFWDKNFTGFNCQIFTKKNTTHDTLGHEIRHCFQGDFHAQPHVH